MERIFEMKPLGVNEKFLGYKSTILNLNNLFKTQIITP